MGLTLSIERKKAIMVIHFGFHNGLLHFHIHILGGVKMGRFTFENSQRAQGEE